MLIQVLDVLLHVLDGFLVVVVGRLQPPQFPASVPSRVNGDALASQVLIELL